MGNNNRGMILLGAALVVLAGLYFVTRGHREKLDTSGGFVDVVEGQLSSDDVYSIEVYKGLDSSQGFILARNGDDWIVSSRHDAPANINKIRTLLGNLEGLEGELRSQDPSVLDAYALDDSNAYRVVIKGESGDPLLELLIGKRSGSGCFVRRAGSDRVLLADHNFLSDFGVWGDDRKAPETTSWIDLVAFETDRAEIERIEIHGEETVVLEKEWPETEAAEGDSTATERDPEAYEWRVLEPRNFLATRSLADAIANNLASVRARDVITRGEVAEEFGLGDGAWTLTVTTEDGASHTLRFGADVPEQSNQIYFQVEGEDIVWSVPSYVRNNLFKKASDLKTE